MIYDTDLDITWLQDANFAATSGYDGDGKMTWDQAVSWADGLLYYDVVRDVALDDWRLPTTPGTGVGSLNEGEMGHLFLSDNIRPTQPGEFSNLQSLRYWLGTEYDADHAWSFYTYATDGYQNHLSKTIAYYAWAVRDGDIVAPVPIASTWFLLGSGLIGLVGIGRKRK